MVKTLVRIGIVLVVGILVYNYFFGDSAEKAQSKKIFGEVKTLVGSVADLVKSEKDKFDAGKYDGVFDKLGGALESIRENADQLDPDMISELNKLEQRKAELEKQLGEIEEKEVALETAESKKGLTAAPNTAVEKETRAQEARKSKMQEGLNDLIRDTDRLLQKAIEK